MKEDLFEPRLIDRKDGRIRVAIEMGRTKVECNLDKWEVRHGVADSGSAISVLLIPRRPRIAGSSHNLPPQGDKK